MSQSEMYRWQLQHHSEAGQARKPSNILSHVDSYLEIQDLTRLASCHGRYSHNLQSKKKNRSIDNLI